MPRTRQVNLGWRCAAGAGCGLGGSHVAGLQQGNFGSRRPWCRCAPPKCKPSIPARQYLFREHPALPAGGTCVQVEWLSGRASARCATPMVTFAISTRATTSPRERCSPPSSRTISSRSLHRPKRNWQARRPSMSGPNCPSGACLRSTRRAPLPSRITTTPMRRTKAPQAAVDSAKAQVTEAQIALDYCELQARPFDSWVLKRNVDVGMLVGPATNGFTLADTRSVKAVFGVPDTAIARIKLGSPQTVTTEALAQRHFPDT